jgi:hypothetical protein
VIDNEGEDYLYPASYFVLLSFPAEVEKILQHDLEIAAHLQPIKLHANPETENSSGFDARQ